MQEKEKVDGFKIFIFATMCLLSSFMITKADTYSTNNNLFENTYTNNLIDMAQTQIEHFNNKKYAIIQIDNSYYLFASNDVSVNGNQITMNNTIVIQAYRIQENYNYYYEYTTKEESQTILNINNIIVSNINTSKSVSSKRYEDYKQNINLKNIGIFILGIVFAIFLTKERNY